MPRVPPTSPPGLPRRDDDCTLKCMPTVEPTYTIDNCRAAYQLNWSLSLFWNQAALSGEQWLQDLQQVTERDGVRILEHRIAKSNVSQFLLSTTPTVAPAMAVRSVKGRLQHLIRKQQPKAFRRNYSIHSTGSGNSQAIERYVESQLNHHRMADSRVQQRLERYQLHRPDIELSAVRNGTYGQFLYNLHIVLVHADRGVDVREEWLQRTTDTLCRAADKKGHLLSRASPVADHIHIMLGCDVTEPPADVVLSYMNNLSHVHGGRAIFQFGFYVGTFGRYDLNALRG